VANHAFDRYHHLANYRSVFERESAQGVGDLALIGTEAIVEQRLRELRDVGVTEFWPILLPVGADGARSLQRTRRLLRDLSPEL
jgi:hypothetical protein